MSPSKTWKSIESRVAALFGTRRAPLSGSNGAVTSSDTLSPSAYVEVKYRKHIPLVSLFRETEEKALLERKLPVLALCERHDGRVYALVPLEPAYLEVLARELAQAQAVRQASLGGPPGGAR